MSLLAVDTMYAANIASIAAAGSHTTAGTTIDVSNVRRVSVQPFMTGGNASATGNVTFYITTSIDGSTWSSTGVPITVKMSGASKIVSEAWNLDVSGAVFIRIGSIANADASYTTTLLNANIWSGF
jgi:hypothetical protein